MGLSLSLLANQTAKKSCAEAAGSRETVLSSYMYSDLCRFENEYFDFFFLSQNAALESNNYVFVARQRSLHTYIRPHFSLAGASPTIYMTLYNI